VTTPAPLSLADRVKGVLERNLWPMAFYEIVDSVRHDGQPTAPTDAGVQSALAELAGSWEIEELVGTGATADRQPTRLWRVAK
jgi:hypothetical protein